jgi:integrase
LTFFFGPYTVRHCLASLYKRERSPFWWVEYIDTAGQRRQESSKLRYASTAETRKAHELRRELSAREEIKFTRSEQWETWVPRFLEQRYSDKPQTLSRYHNSWRNVSAFLCDQAIIVPRQLSRQQVRDFVDWRQHRHPALGVYEVRKNTALHEVKLLRVLMREAEASGFCSGNPCAGLGIKLDPAPRKPRITDAEHEKILKALKREPKWMQVSYAIAWEQGCRFSETCLPLKDIDLRRGVIGFRTKGEKDSVAEFPLSPNLHPLFERLIRDGRTATFEMPEMPGKAWWRFFKRNKLQHLCFHCTRVTFITRCYERGIPRDEVMRLAGHTSTAAHAIYPRLSASHQRLQDLMKQLAA